MTKKGLPTDYIQKTDMFIEHPSELIPIKSGLFTMVPIESIIVPLEQVRKYFDKQGMEELKHSIQKNGLIQPIVVREENSSIYLVSGERRLRALKMLEIKQVPVIFTDKQPDIIAIIENLQREDLTPFEEAYAYYSLKMKYKATLNELSETVGKDPKYISRIMRLVDLPDSIKNEFVTSRISKELLIRISQISDKHEQLRVWNILKTGEFTVRQAKTIIKPASDHKNSGFDLFKVQKYMNNIQKEIKKSSNSFDPNGIEDINLFIRNLEDFLNNLKDKLNNSNNEVSKSNNEVK